MSDELLDNPRALAERIAGALGGDAVERADLNGFVSSDYDPFLNQLFASGPLTREDAAAALDGHPAFVWLDETPRGEEVLLMQGMVAELASEPIPRAVEAEIVEVETQRDLDGWHDVYSEVLGCDRRSRSEWTDAYAALGPGGDRSFLLFLASVGGSPAATGAAFFDGGSVGLYCFATRESMRGRGLASALVRAAHSAARAKGIDRAVLQATVSGRPVYARCAYRDARPMPVFRFPPGVGPLGENARNLG